MNVGKYSSIIEHLGLDRRIWKDFIIDSTEIDGCVCMRFGAGTVDLAAARAGVGRGSCIRTGWRGWDW